MKTIECPSCNGSGVEIYLEHDPKCNGSCVYCPVQVPYPCSLCAGDGTIPLVEKEDLEITPPPIQSEAD